VKRLAALAPLVLLVAAACGGQQAAQEPAPAPPTARQETVAQEDAHPRGGTLRAALANPNFDMREAYIPPDGAADYTLDPHVTLDPTSWELFRCCLLRTLMSYNGRPTSEGGAELRPDLADGMPEVSPDGLTWTFRLKPGIRYAPPYADREIVAADFVRALERLFVPAVPSWAEAFGSPILGTYAGHYEPLIEGTTAFKDGVADSISGLEAPDDHTLVVHLTRPAGDLGIRFALAATAPIPPGAADGHDDGYGPFLAASGPYMLEEYLPRSSVTLVRNPSWDPAGDDLREAYVDGIELALLGFDEAVRKLEAGELDLVFDVSPEPELVDRFRSDPELERNVAVFPVDGVGYVTLNIAQPPFDDVHVRKAVNLALDKQVLRQGAAGFLREPWVVKRATHIAPDFLENNLLLDYDPYATPGDRGNLEGARTELARSSYDADGDGTCDGPACSGVRAVTLSDPWLRTAADSVAERLAQLGIELDFTEVEDLFAELAPEKHVGLNLFTTWARDFPGGASYFPALFDSSTIPPSCCNWSLVGASPEQLATWGYDTASVPSVDAKLGECQRLVGGAAFQCWAELDQLLMEEVVPVVPFGATDNVRVASARVVNLVVDQAFQNPSLDRIALETGSH
jgi:peptide/nickel transport system substrate-binding protein